MEDPQFWIGIFGNLGVAGALGWYMWYNVTVTQPGTLGKLFDRVDALSAKHDLTVSSISTLFAEAIKEERSARRQDLQDFRSTLQLFFDEHKRELK